MLQSKTTAIVIIDVVSCFLFCFVCKISTRNNNKTQNFGMFLHTQDTVQKISQENTEQVRASCSLLKIDKYSSDT